MYVKLDIYSIARVISNDNLYYFVCWYLLVVDHSYGGNFWIEISTVKNKGRKTDLKIPALWLVNIQLKKNKEIAVCFYSSYGCSILFKWRKSSILITISWKNPFILTAQFFDFFACFLRHQIPKNELFMKKMQPLVLSFNYLI